MDRDVAKIAEKDQPLIVRASLSKPFEVSSSWSASPPSQHRFTGRAERDGLRYIRPLSAPCSSSSGPMIRATPNVLVLGDRLSATWPVDSFGAFFFGVGSYAQIPPTAERLGARRLPDALTHVV